MLVAEAESVLRLVHDALAAAAVDVLVLGAAELVAGILGGGLLAIGLDATSNLITGAGKSLLQLLLGRLG